MVFAGLYPVEGHEYPELRDALEKLRLNDASFFYEPETSAALGFGFRCGFLGLLHMEIVQERLEREFDLDLVTTAPGVLYRVTTTDGEVHEIDSPAKLPDAGRIAKIEEPVITAMILTPAEYVGGILQLCQEKRGVQKALEYLASDRVLITYELPFAEVVLDFYDRLKTISRGYASLDYHVSGYWESPLREARHPGQRRAGRRAVDHRATATRPTRAAGRWRRRCASSSRGRCSRWRSRRPSAAGSSPARRSRRCARTCWPSATAATSRASASCSRSRRKARSG